jgi:hypothetical protein
LFRILLASATSAEKKYETIHCTVTILDGYNHLDHHCTPSSRIVCSLQDGTGILSGTVALKASGKLLILIIIITLITLNREAMPFIRMQETLYVNIDFRQSFLSFFVINCPFNTTRILSRYPREFRGEEGLRYFRVMMRYRRLLGQRIFQFRSWTSACWPIP